MFHDVAWAGQRVLDTSRVAYDPETGTLGGVGDGLPAKGIGVGSVVVVEGAALEVASVVDTDRVVVSRVGDGFGLADIARAEVDVVAHTFAAQLAVVHRQLLGTLGLREGATEQGGALAEDRITNGDALVEAEACGALHMIYAGASALVGESSPLWVKARVYGDRFRDARRRSVVELDIDGDGVAEAVRRMSLVQLVRA
ncbi:MAG: hypothetical protein AAGH64_01560 [Planctomycetota bacterium]